MNNDNAKIWMQDNYGLLIACCIGAIVINCAMICFMNLTRTVPINYILLGLFTVCEAYMVASVAAVSETEAVLAAAFSTSAIVISITVYVWFTKTDFTVLGPLIVILGMSMCMISLFIFAFKFN